AAVSTALPGSTRPARPRLRRRHGNLRTAVRAHRRGFRGRDAGGLQRLPGDQQAGRDRGDPRLVHGSRRRRAGDGHLPLQPHHAARVRAAGPRARDQRGRGLAGPPRGRSLLHAREAALRGRLHRPQRLPAVGERPHAGEHHLRPARPRVPGAGGGADRGRGGRAAGGDLAGHPGGEGGHLRMPRRHPRVRAPRRAAGAGDAGHLRPHAAGHGHRGGHGDAGVVAGRRGGAQLLHRARAHAAAHPLPGRERAPPRLVHPQRGDSAQRRRRGGVPAGAGALRGAARRVRERARRARGGRLLRHHAGAHPRAGGARGRREAEAQRGSLRPPALLRHPRHGPDPGAAAHHDRRAGQRAGEPQGQAPPAERRLRRRAGCGPRPDGERRARAGRVRGPHRAAGRGRADEDGGQAPVAGSGCAALHRQHRGARDRSGAEAIAGARHRQLHQPGERARALRRGAPGRGGARCGGDRADHRPRPGRDVQDARDQAGGRPEDPRHRGGRVRAAAVGPDLRRAHLHAGHGRRGVPQVGRGDHRGDPRHQGGAPRCADHAGRVQRVVRPVAGGARGAQLRVPAPLRGGGAGHGHHQPRARQAVLRDPGRRAQARQRPDLRPAHAGARPAGRVHRLLREHQHGGGVGRRPHRRHGAGGSAALEDPAPQEGRGGGVDRPRRGEAGRRARAERRAAAGHEGSGRQVRCRRADPPLRAAERGGDEARGGPAGELPGEGGGADQGEGGAGHGVRRRARHRQEPGEYHPHQQRLHGVRPRQAGARQHHHREGAGGGRGRHRPVGAPGLHLQADAAVRAGAAQARPQLPAAGGGRGHQPVVRARRGAGGRRNALPGRDVLLQGRLRGPVHHGQPDGGERHRVRARAQRGDAPPLRRLRRGQEQGQGDAPRFAREPGRRPRGRPHAPLLGVEGACQPPRGGRGGLHRPQHAVPDAVGRAQPQGRGVGPPGARGLRAAPGALRAGGAHAGVAAPAGDLRLLPGGARRRRGGGVRSQGPRPRGGPLRLPAPGRPRGAVPGGLLPPAGRRRPQGRPPAAGGDERRPRGGVHRAPHEGRRLQRGLLPARLQCADGRGRRRAGQPPRPRGAGNRRAARPALLVGLPGLPRRGAARAALQAAPGEGVHRRRADGGVPAGPGAVDGRAGRAPPGGEVLLDRQGV
ncbi:MAG: 5-methyltetrahydrofolate--homocysteine methyltransferase, partial [uncultured Gemmatimonadetes bacterium]